MEDIILYDASGDALYTLSVYSDDYSSPDQDASVSLYSEGVNISEDTTAAADSTPAVVDSSQLHEDLSMLILILGALVVFLVLDSLRKILERIGI